MKRILSEVSPEVKTQAGRSGRDGEHVAKDRVNETAGSGNYGDWMPEGASGKVLCSDWGSQASPDTRGDVGEQAGAGGTSWTPGASPSKIPGRCITRYILFPPRRRLAARPRPLL